MKKMLFLIVMVMLALVGCAGNQQNINLADYLPEELEYEGLNKKADVKEIFKEDVFEEYLISMNQVEEDSLENATDEELEEYIEKGISRLEEVSNTMDSLEIVMEKNGSEVETLQDLKNGDKIRITAKILPEENEILKLKFIAGTKEYTVAGLEDGVEVDVFAEVNLEVFFVGTDGNGQVLLSWNEDILPELSIEFHVEKATACCNGDEIKVVLDYNREKWEDCGYFPAEESKTYVVEGLSQILKTVEEIPSEQFEEMRTNVEATIKKQVENEWRDGTYLEGMRYLGSYLLTKKDLTMGLGSPNILYLIYEVDAFENYAPAGGEDSHLRYYYCCSYENLLIDKYGKIDMELAYFSECYDGFLRNVCMGSSVLLNSVMVNYDGFETLEELVHECVNNYLNQYSYTTTVEEILE